MAEFKVGDKVNVIGMRDPGMVISGPHESHGGSRWLVRKADGNVTLARPPAISAYVETPAQRVAEIISQEMYGTGMGARDSYAARRISSAAEAIVAELAKSETPRPLAVGDRIRILTGGYLGASVDHGEIRRVTKVGPGAGFQTDTRPASWRSYWSFTKDDEGTAWERA